MLDDTPPRDGALPEATHGLSPTPTGTRLREARLRRGLTIAESATDTRINPAYLEAMEAERWELLPAPVYARGFLRSYARYLRFAPDEIEAMVPRSLPRPRDLEPAPGLRRSAAQPALSLPSFKWLRGTGDPRPPRGDVRQSAPLGATRPPASLAAARSGASREAGSAGVGRPPLARPTRANATVGSRLTSSAPAGPGVAFARLRAMATDALLDARRASAPALTFARRNPTSLAAGVVAALVLLVGAYALPRVFTSNATPSAGPSSGTPRASASPGPTVSQQLAGPEPGSSPVPSAGTPASAAPAAPTRDGGMPDLTGLMRRDAEDELNRRGLAFVVIEVATPAAEPGSVYNQSPQPGKDVKRGDSVTLLVARAP